MLSAKLVKFDRDPVRYNADDSIQEFRIHVRAAVKFKDLVEDETIWSTKEISGESTYFLSGRLAKSEDEAVEEALEDLVRHVIERILEVW